MVSGPASQWPMVLTFRLVDGRVIDARVTVMHRTIFVELPVLISVGPEPVTGIIVPFISEANSDTCAVESPQLLDEPVVKLALPFAGKEMLDFLPARHKLRPVPPVAIDGIG